MGSDLGKLAFNVLHGGNTLGSELCTFTWSSPAATHFGNWLPCVPLSGCLPCLGHFPFPHSSLPHFPNHLFASESLSQGLFLGQLELRLKAALPDFLSEFQIHTPSSATAPPLTAYGQFQQGLADLFLPHDLPSGSPLFPVQTQGPRCGVKSHGGLTGSPPWSRPVPLWSQVLHTGVPQAPGPVSWSPPQPSLCSSLPPG